MVDVELPTLPRWSKHLPASDVQDPLGLSLRGGARLGASLLYCITSISPRARYFSFVPWCILDFQKNEKGKPHATGLEEALVLREHALTLGCVAHHEGKVCDGGNLVGSDKAAIWFRQHPNDTADFRKLRFAKNPAYYAYYRSLINLGIFVMDDALPQDELSQDENGDKPDRTFEDIELSPLGIQLAESYGSAVNGLAVVKQIGSVDRRCSTSSLKQLGKHGGLCEITAASAPDRQLLRDVLFCRTGLADGSHQFRRKTFLLMLEHSRQLGQRKAAFSQAAFADAVYYGHVDLEQGVVPVPLPASLDDIALRWRMFYFHYYAGVALEALFSWVVSDVGAAGLSGRTIDDIVHRLGDRTVRTGISKIVGHDLDSTFLDTTPSKLMGLCGVHGDELSAVVSKALNVTIGMKSPVAERSLETPLWDMEFQQTPLGVALPMLLMVVTLGRYKEWESTNYGDWLAQTVNDPYLDLVPPVLMTALNRHFGNWWNRSMGDLTRYVLSRFVVQQHQAMSYEKTFAGDRCLLHVDGPRITASGVYDKIAVGNPRFRSAHQILLDLALIQEDDEGITYLTPDGKAFLKEELAKDGGR